MPIELTVQQATDRVRCKSTSGDIRVATTGFKNAGMALAAKIDRLNAILAPFQAVAEKIPDHWNGEYHLTARRHGKSTALAPWLPHAEYPDPFPTVDQWRATRGA